MNPLDPFASYRPGLLAGLRRAVDGLAFSHAAPLKDQLSLLAGGGAAIEPALAPALLCLLVTKAVGGGVEAEPAATALALLGSMSLVFGGMSGSPAGGSVTDRWGLPRALNAGDAFFALAQTYVAATAADPERRLQACDLFDSACRNLSEELRAAGPQPARAFSPALLASGAALGALIGGADAGTVSALAAQKWGVDGLEAGSLDRISLSEDLRQRLAEASDYVAKFR